jgi:4-hydroxybenzoate polyprenyltransferase
VPSYTSTYGIAKTLLWYRMTILLSTTALGYVLWVSHSQSLWAWGCLGLALVGGLSSHSKSSSKKFELAGTVFLLLSMLAMVWM